MNLNLKVEQETFLANVISQRWKSPKRSSNLFKEIKNSLNSETLSCDKTCHLEPAVKSASSCNELKLTFTQGLFISRVRCYESSISFHLEMQMFVCGLFWFTERVGPLQMEWCGCLEFECITAFTQITALGAKYEWKYAIYSRRTATNITTYFTKASF